ncbi:hypothetical protein GGQ80_003543 [Sphingomonas jinjuensis]|uniref:Uncharacterized protein n=1 Tax=Sphingomonas jinjuensis TaxID=535907 RepID=A0A840FP04_9SPHN|nr:hypothetical protein [Sphingomonas jinjuensis]
MTVPEAAVHLNNNAMFGKHEIGAPWEVASMQPKAISELMSQLANGQLRGGMLAPHTRHHPASGLSIDNIHNWLSGASFTVQRRPTLHRLGRKVDLFAS